MLLTSATPINFIKIKEENILKKIVKKLNKMYERTVCRHWRKQKFIL